MLTKLNGYITKVCLNTHYFYIFIIKKIQLAFRSIHSIFELKLCIQIRMYTH